MTGCPNLRYIGMCCSLYEEKSANVDIAAAREKGIVVTGVKDYGDEGVVEYVISELVRYLHGLRPEAVARRSDGDHRPEGRASSAWARRVR